MGWDKPKSMMRTWGIVLTVLGGFLIVVSVIIGGMLYASSTSKITETAQGLSTGGFQHLKNGTGTVEVQPEANYRIYAGKDEKSTVFCTVESSAGEQITVENFDSSHDSYNPTEAQAGVVYAFNAGENSTVQVSCDDLVAIGPPMDIASTVLGGVGAMVLMLVGGGLGLIILIVGIVLWALGASRRKKISGMQNAGRGGYDPSGAGYNRQSHQ